MSNAGDKTTGRLQDCLEAVSGVVTFMMAIRLPVRKACSICLLLACCVACTKPAQAPGLRRLGQQNNPPPKIELPVLMGSSAPFDRFALYRPPTACTHYGPFMECGPPPPITIWTPWSRPPCKQSGVGEPTRRLAVVETSGLWVALQRIRLLGPLAHSPQALLLRWTRADPCPIAGKSI